MTETQPLLTPAALALSRSPPRIPPPDSWIHHLHYYSVDDLLRLKRHEIRHLLSKHTSNTDKSHELLSRLLMKIVQNGKSCMHYSSSCIENYTSLPDRITRYVGSKLPLAWQHDFRDSGKFRKVADGMVKLSAPLLAFGGMRWKEVSDFIELSHSDASKGSKWKRQLIRYGEHKMQFINLFWPDLDRGNKGSKHNNSQNSQQVCIRGTIFFVHGGAWGSGQPWMYRLIAPYFLQRGFLVAVVGYRTYPCVTAVTPDLDSCGGNASGLHGDSQLCDIKSAWDALQSVMQQVMADYGHSEGWVGNVVMGHSSGAHIALLMIVDMTSERLKNSDNNCVKLQIIYPDYFIGLSGPYDISNHYDFEAMRGVEQISPMKAICGGSPGNFSIASPVSRLNATFLSDEIASTNLQTVQECTPRILLVHGIEDTTVPFTATADSARSLQCCGLVHCEEVYLEKCGHQDVIMQFMIGGAAPEIVMDYLLSSSYGNLGGPLGSQQRRVDITSRL